MGAQLARADTWQISAGNRNAWDDTFSGSINLCDFGDAFWDDSCGLAWAVTIPPNATVLSAKVRVFSNNHIGNAGAYTVRIRVEDVDSAATFTGAPNNVRGRAYWTTTVDWNIPAGGLPFPAWSESPDISSLIQHIVDRPGWSSGNFINVAIWGQTNAGGGGAFENISPFPTNPAELVVTYVPPQPLYRSVGITATNLNTGGRTVQIAGSTASFSGSMPDNVGVGDVLAYASGGNQIAFIHGRISATEFTVKDKTGGTPVAAPGATAAGVYRAYTSLSNWESQTENGNIVEPIENDVNPSLNLVAANTILNVACYADGADTTPVLINGWTTDNGRYINIFTPTLPSEVGASQRHDGVFGTGYRMNLTNAWAIDNDAAYVRIEGLVIQVTANNNNLSGGIASGPAGAGEVRISHNIIKGVITDGVLGYPSGIQIGANGANVHKIWNNVVYNFPHSTAELAQCIALNDGTAYVFNNTVFNCNTGIIKLSGMDAAEVRNNVSINFALNASFVDYKYMASAPAAIRSANVSSDASSETAALRNKTAYANYFKNTTPGTEDFHLKGTSLGLWTANGTDLSAHASLPVTNDIDRGSRVRPDIGADEFLAIALYRSVGTLVTPLASGAANGLTISGSTATFTGALPNNVGVGDAIQYDSDGNSSIDSVAFIHGRTSSQSYSVKNSAGAAPTPVAGDNDWALYRAYTTLANWESLSENANIDLAVRNFDTSTDLVAAGAVLLVACYGDGPDNSGGATGVIINGWTTGAETYIHLFTPVSSFEVGTTQRHSGVWDTTKYRLVGATTFGGRLLIQDEYVRVTGLQIENTAAKDQEPAGIELVGGSAVVEARLASNILRATGTGTPNSWTAGIVQYPADGTVLKVSNNVIYDWGTGIRSEFSTTTNDVILYNNTVANNLNLGILLLGHAAGSYRLANNLVQGAGTNYSITGGIAYSATNLSEDATSPQVVLRNKTVTFVGAPDYHLSAADTNAKDTGTNLSLDPVLAVFGDIDGQIRQAPWDIGADDANGTTAVALISFSATGLDSGVELTWETGSETNNMGFHLYRASSENGPFSRITLLPIPGLGSSPEGARYAYTDGGLTNGTTYFYELEDIETTGRTERHGPVAVTPGAGPSSQAPSPRARITYGAPEGNELRVLSRDTRGAVVELVTRGFYAEPRDDGSVRIVVPGFVEEEGTALPVRRFWLDVVAGRRVSLKNVRAEEEVLFEGLSPADGSIGEAYADSDGIVRTRRRRVSSTPRPPGREMARILEVGFQSLDKKALLELAPIRPVEQGQGLLMTRRLVVTVSFAGREPMEETTDGVHGRRRAPGVPTSGDVVTRLVTRERGLHAVRYEDIFSGRSRALNRFRLSRLGQPVPYHLEPADRAFGRGSVLFFFSEGPETNPYADESVHELTVADDVNTMEVLPAQPSGDAVSWYWHRERREENHYYQAALTGAEDIWLWDVLMAPAAKSYRFEVHDLASNAEPRLQVWLQGTSDFEAEIDHHLRVFVNGTLAGEALWNGKEAYVVEAAVPRGLLQEGENSLSLENVGDTEAAYSMVMLNRFDVTYPRWASGELEGAWSEGGMAEVRGAQPAAIIQLSDRGPRWLTGYETGPDGVTRFHVDEGARYYVASAPRSPQIRDVTTSRRRFAARQSVDWLLVGPQAFLPSAAPLVAHRRKQGMKVRAVAVEEVYDAFGHGESRPEAIRDFLRFAYFQWSVKYVLLLGDGTYDYKDYLQTGVRNQVPPLMVRTSYLWTASDPAYASVNGTDSLPDLAIGRLPASSVDEVKNLVGKIVAFETSPKNPSAPIVLVADNPDDAGNFVGNAEELSGSVLAGYSSKKIYLGSIGAEVARSGIVSSFDEGARLMSYIGHGGIHLWASENILNASDVALLSPQPDQPVLLTMNCLNGYFHFPYFDSLAEALLKANARGAIATISPSGLSLDRPAHVYHRVLLEELVRGGHQRIGDAVMAAQRRYAETGSFPELLSIFHLLGDPALTLPR